MNIRLCVLPLLGLLTLTSHAADPALVVVEDRGGASALAYYQALDLQPQASRRERPPPRIELPPQGERLGETDMLPVRSPSLTPGAVERRVIEAPGLRPLFLLGDDEHSRLWLRQRADTLRELGAVGLVVNIESQAALDALRHLAPELLLSSVSADDLARRLGLRHYPVLITATGIEQ